MPALVLAATSLVPAFAGPAVATAQQPSSLFGTLFDQQTRQPLPGGTVTVGEDGSPVQTGQDGSFLISDLSPGVITLRIAAPGYTTAVEQVEVGSGRTFHQFAILPLSATLGEVRVLAGVGAAGSDGRVGVEDDILGSAQTAADLLASRVPGLFLGRESGSIGVGAPVRIRGISTITQSSDPLVYLDGVRIGQRGTGDSPIRTTPIFDLLQDIPASQVESIRVLRGSSAAARYGDSANGVIVIETHRNR